MKTIEVYADGQGIAACTGPTCGTRILWATVVASGRKMCFDMPITVLSSRKEGHDRPIQVVDLAGNHWATCPDRKRFSSKGR